MVASLYKLLSEVAAPSLVSPISLLVYLDLVPGNLVDSVSL